MDLLQKFIAYIKSENLFQSRDKLLLAVSGGVDSVVLCELCKLAGYDFSIAHCNFTLRGADSDRDETFVKALAEKYQVKCFVKKFDTKLIATQQKKSIEETARDLRYAWFRELITDDEKQTTNVKVQNVPGRHYILTAHHADDNIETVLMNIFRGTGIKGLRGILPKNNSIIRPLLFATKKELKDFAQQNNLGFVEDHTNAENEYTRNYFRNELIPSVKKVYPKAAENILRNIERMTDVAILYEQSIDFHKKHLVEYKGNEIHIPILKLLKTVPVKTVLYEICKYLGFTAHQSEEIISLIKSDTGKYVQSSTHRAIKNRNWLIISPNQTTIAENILIESENSVIEFASGKIQVRKVTAANFKLSTDQSVASIDAKNIVFPLLLRKWKQGDYFYPLGMQKKKKLNRFLIDQKLSLPQKENVWVIESNKKIIWVVGMRIDDRFKFTDQTKEILQFSLTVTK